MTVSVQNTEKYIRGSTAVEICASVERAIHREKVAPGDPLPTVRGVARALGVSPATVASAYRTLRERGLIVTRGRRGTRIAGRPPLAARRPAPLPAGVVDLADGNPDPKLLPELAGAVARIDPAQRLYGAPISHAPLVQAFARAFRADAIPAEHLVVVSGALDGLERALRAHLRPGDAVAVEDPVFSGVLDLLHAIGMVPVPMRIDDSGPEPEAMRSALERGAVAAIVTPRAQNPTGAALDAGRVRALRRVLRDFPDVLILEDDHAGPVAGVACQSLCDGKRHAWAVVRSVSKSLGPDLRVAVLTGDPTTVARVEGGTIVGIRWVSHLLQRIVVELLAQRGMNARLRKAARVYTQRRNALIDALAAHGIGAHGRSGLNVWVPVAHEAETVGLLLDRGWAVTPGQRFRLECPPAIRVCVAALEPDRASGLADEIARIVLPGAGVSAV